MLPFFPARTNACTITRHCSVDRGHRASSRRQPVVVYKCCWLPAALAGGWEGGQARASSQGGPNPLALSMPVLLPPACSGAGLPDGGVGVSSWGVSWVFSLIPFRMEVVRAANLAAAPCKQAESARLELGEAQGDSLAGSHSPFCTAYGPPGGLGGKNTGELLARGGHNRHRSNSFSSTQTRR